MKLFGFLQIIFERQGPEKGTFIYCILYHLLHLAYAAWPSLIHILTCTYSHSPLDLCVLDSCWGIATVALISANHVYVTNKVGFDLI